MPKRGYRSNLANARQEEQRKVAQEETCARYAVYVTIDDAYRAGDLDALLHACADMPNFPNSPRSEEFGFGYPLEYAIYWSPLPFIRTLLEYGADPTYDGGYGFPSLIAALSTKRPDKRDIIRLLLEFGADVHQRGVNDWTPLHYAANIDDPEAITLLLAHGADPNSRTRIDGCTTPSEEAERLGHARVLESLKGR
jgi:hypothetical protein